MTASGSPSIPDHVEHRIRTPDGRTLAVTEWGDPNGVPLFSCHGTPGGRIAWPKDLTIYGRHGIRRMVFDRPGYGESTRLPGRTVADGVPDVVAIADALDIERFAITGNSGGGPHALACAALLPERVLRCQAVVSIAPYPAKGLDWLAGMSEGNVAEFGAALEGEAATRAVVERGATFMLEQVAAGNPQIHGDEYEMPESDRKQIAGAQAMLAAQVIDALAPGIDGWVDDNLAFARPWGFDVSDIRLPVYLQYGSDDSLVPKAHGDWLAAHIPGAKVVVLDAGHYGDSSLVESDLAWLAGETA